MSKRKKQDILKAIEKINEDGLRDKKEVNKEVIIKRIMAEYKLTQSTAVTYYYEWKKQYMKTDKCIPKAEKVKETVVKKEKTRGKFIIVEPTIKLEEILEVTKEDKPISVSIDDKEIIKDNVLFEGGIIEDVVKKEVVKKDTKKLIVSFGVFEGDHAIYTKDSSGVRIGKEKKIYKTKEDVEEYQEELLKEVDSMVQELLKVIELGGIINA